jgi:hypothetical protein
MVPAECIAMGYFQALSGLYKNTRGVVNGDVYFVDSPFTPPLT